MSVKNKSLIYLLSGLFALVAFSRCELASRITGESINSIKSPEAKEVQLRGDIIDYAREFLGSKYKYAGRDPKGGFDCSGFTHYVMKKFDIKLSASSRDQEHQGAKIKVNDAQPGDLIFFRRSKTGSVFHVAMVVSNDNKGLRVIHSTSRGVVIDNIDQSSYWKPKVSTARNVVTTGA